MHELYAYVGMRIYFMWLTAKANTEINYEIKSETNYCKTWNYARSENNNYSIYSMSKTTLYFQKSKLTNYPTLVIELYAIV